MKKNLFYWGIGQINKIVENIGKYGIADEHLSKPNQIQK